MQEIVLPDSVKPALEWVNNRILQKVSPTPGHARAQSRFSGALDAWATAGDLGLAGTEMRFQIQPPGEIRRSLVPDVAFVSYERAPDIERDLSSAPTVAPEVVVEVRSPDDRQPDIDEKVRVYLAAGTHVVFLVDPEKRKVVAVDAQGLRDLSEGTIVHEALPGFSLDPALLFDRKVSGRQ